MLNEREWNAVTALHDVMYAEMNQLGGIFTAFKEGRCYSDSEWESILTSVKYAVVYVTYIFVEYDFITRKTFQKLYEEENVEYVPSIEDAADMFQKLYFDLCYDMSMVPAFNNDDSVLTDAVLRDAIAIGSMFMTKRVMEDLIFESDEIFGDGEER